jgi:hypothetical protein
LISSASFSIFSISFLESFVTTFTFLLLSRANLALFFSILFCLSFLSLAFFTSRLFFSSIFSLALRAFKFINLLDFSFSEEFFLIIFTFVFLVAFLTILDFVVFFFFVEIVFLAAFFTVFTLVFLVLRHLYYHIQ